MRNFGKLGLPAGILIFFVFSAAAQWPPRTPRPNEETSGRDGNIIERSRALQRVENRALQSRQETLRRARNPRPKPLTKEERAELERLIAVDEADRAAHREFLKRPLTGIFRLFPDLDCDEKMIVRVDGQCAGLLAGTWSYSFRQRGYGGEDFFDIRFRDGRLTSDGFLAQGLLVDLGDEPLERLSLHHAGLKYLFDFAPAADNAEAKKQAARFVAGVAQNGFIYARSVAAAENRTYALRVVAYRLPNKFERLLRFNEPTREGGIYFRTFFDKRKDVTVVFRVVRRDANGSLTILWKILEEHQAPELVYPKNEMPSNLHADR